MNDVVEITDPLDLTKLFNSEKIWLWRRRQENPNGRSRGRGGKRMSVNEAAAFLDVPLNVYTAAEADLDLAATRIVKEAIGGNLDQAPSPAELCTLARRRSGADVADICQALGGISKPTFFQRENGGDQQLVDYWQTCGYRFAKNR